MIIIMIKSILIIVIINIGNVLIENICFRHHSIEKIAIITIKLLIEAAIKLENNYNKNNYNNNNNNNNINNNNDVNRPLEVGMIIRR